MNKRWSSMSKKVAVTMALAALVAAPLSASAHDRGGRGYHGGYGHHGYNDGGYGHRGYYGGGYGHRGYDNGGYRNHGGHWGGGRWIAGALITGAAIGLVADALRPAPVYYESPRVVYRQPSVVYYNQPARVIYEGEQPVTRVVETRRVVIYDDPSETRYVRDDGYDGD